MKHICLLPLFLTLSVSAQTNNNGIKSIEPFKRANVILILVEGAKIEDSFQTVGQTLIELGYTLDKTDGRFHTIQTNSRNLSGNLTKAATSIIIRTSARNLSTGSIEVKLTGSFGASGESPTEEITYRGMKGSPFMVSFEELDKAAKQIAASINGQVRYASQ